MQAKLTGINTVRKQLADGSVRVYFYHRRTGAKLIGEPGSPEFITSYANAEKQVFERHEGLCGSLIRDFLTSPEFENNLQPSTQSEYRRILTVVEVRFGRAPIAAMEDLRFLGDLMEWRDEIANSKPREADNRMVVLGRALSWAKKRQRLSANVLEGYERLHRSDRSDKLWLPEHIVAMHEVASPPLWSLFSGALHTGLRQGDLRKLPWSAYDGKTITWRITKRRKGDAGVKVTIPCTAELRSVLGSFAKTWTAYFYHFDGTSLAEAIRGPSI